jgi:hypothetical protein
MKEKKEPQETPKVKKTGTRSANKKNEEKLRAYLDKNTLFSRLSF